MDLWRVHRIEDNMLFTEDTIIFESFYPSLATSVSIQSFDEGTTIDSCMTLYKPNRIPSNPSTSWSSFISRQADWIQRLLDDQTLIDSATPFEIMKFHDEYKLLLTVSDGSVIFHNMRFG